MTLRFGDSSAKPAPQDHEVKRASQPGRCDAETTPFSYPELYYPELYPELYPEFRGSVPMQRKAARTSGGLLFVATGCVRAHAYFMLLSFDSSLTVSLSS